jgi:hypothetical protein
VCGVLCAESFVWSFVWCRHFRVWVWFFEFESLIPVAPLLRSVSVAGLSRKPLERKQGMSKSQVGKLCILFLL